MMSGDAASSFHDPNDIGSINRVRAWSDSDDDEGGGGSDDHCPLCAFADEAGAAGGPMAHIRSMYAQMAACTSARTMWVSIARAYDDLYRTPLTARGVAMPHITAKNVSLHFRRHERSSVHALVTDIRRMEQMQRYLMPRRETQDGAKYVDREQMAAWLQLSKAKQDAIKLLEVEQRQHQRAITVTQTAGASASNDLEAAVSMMSDNQLC